MTVTMRRRASGIRIRTAAALLLAMLALMGVSGCEPQSGRAVLALQSYFYDLGHRRWTTACGRLTPVARWRVSTDYGAPCAVALQRARGDGRAMDLARLGGVSIAGSAAVVGVVPFGTDPHRPLYAPLILANGRWWVSDPYAPEREPGASRAGRVRHGRGSAGLNGR